MIRVPYPKPIRKVPRRFHHFQPFLSQRNSQPCGECLGCLARMQEQVDNERPGHVWSAVDGEVVYEEDVVACGMLSRPLGDNEIVVHRDGNPKHNNPENLKVVTIDKLEIE